MSEWAAKRFWTDVEVTEDEAGFGIRLDGRPVKTPAKAPLQVPTRAIADAVATEWQSIEGKIDPNVMPYTRSANAAIDKVTPQFTEVADMLAAYAESDLLCYRAEAPAALVDRQADRWDPMLDWAQDTFGGRLVPTTGLMPVAQNVDAVRRLTAPIYKATPFGLTALHDLISLSGSVVLALRVTQGHLSPDAAWSLSRLDEDWQAEQWGHDAEAEEAAEIKRLAFEHAADFHNRLVDKRRG